MVRDWLERFWEKVDKSAGPDACWPWTGAYNTAKRRDWEGEGRRRPIFRLGGGGRKGDVQIMVYAHRLALCLHDGSNYDDHAGQECCHDPVVCNNFRCVNPRHLRWDTPEGNRRDRYGDPRPGTNVPVPLNDEGNMTRKNDKSNEGTQDLPMDEAQNEASNTTPATGQPVPETPQGETQGNDGGTGSAEPQTDAPATPDAPPPATPAHDRG